MNPLDEFLTKFAAQNNEVELWQKWKDNNEHPDHFQPLYKKFEPTINSQVNKFARNPNVPKTRISFEADKMFLKACQSFDPSQAQLKTHVINHLKKLSRFVGDNSNTGKISEPRRLMIHAFNHSKDTLSEELGKAPSLEEIMKHMNVDREEQGHEAVKINDLKRLQSELSKRDLSESLAMNDAELYKTPKEQQAIVMLHYSTPIAAGEKHQYRLTPDEHNVFKRIFPLSEEGALDLDKTMKLKDIATELHFSAPKVSRTIKTLNKKLLKATELI